MGNVLSPSATITATKSGSNPTLNTQALLENAILVGDTWYAVYQTGNTTDTLVPWNVHLATASSIAGPWTPYSGNPVLQISDIAWASFADARLSAPELRKFGDTYYIYVAVFDWNDGTNGYLACATASTVTGPYTDSGAAILSPGSTGAWDSLRVSEPSVIYDGYQYVMAFMAETDADAFTNSEKVGIATADHPLGPWTKASHNPVLPFGAAGTWDDEVVADAFLFIDGGYYWMWYTGGGTAPNGSPWSSGLAYASDPLGPWTKHASNPILSYGAGGAWDDEAAFRGCVIPVAGTYHVLYTGHAGSFVFKGGNATLTVTAPSPGVWIDWAQDGFAASGTTTSEAGQLARMMPEGGSQSYSDNITTDVRSFTWARGGTGDLLGGASQDTATIIVKNTLGKYNPDNTASVLAGLLKPGKPVWIGANADGTLSGTGQTVYGVFAGRLREIAPIAAGGATDAPEVELLCDGILTDYARTPVRLADDTTRSQARFRADVLEAMGENAARLTLADEPDTLPLSSTDATDALGVLESLNRANGSRHTAIPSASLDGWYTYTSYNRQYKLGVTPSIALTATTDHLTEIDGLRLNAETVINDQEATVDPVDFPRVASNIWEYANAPFDVTGNLTIWADFGDYVADPTLVLTSAGAAVTSSLTPFGSTAKITLYSTGATVTRLYVDGRAVIRNATIKVNTDLSPFVAPSQAAYGSRSGSPLSGDLVGARAAAQGMVDHIVYRYHDPLRRPRITLVNWIPGIFTTALYDPVTLTVTQFDMTTRWFDIVGIEGSCDLAASSTVLNWQVAYQLQEASLQSAVTFFTLDTSTLGGSNVLGY